MINRIFPVILMAALIAALSGGCGSGSDAADTSKAVLPKQQFVSKAEAICKQSEKEIYERVSAYSTKHPGSSEVELVEPGLDAPFEKRLAKLEALGAPAGEADAVEAMNKEFADAFAKAKEEPAALLKPASNPFVKANEMATSVGIAACSYKP
jgi:hypothetical protein